MFGIGIVEIAIIAIVAAGIAMYFGAKRRQG
jgi:type IV secretory pathway VirB2 component (pilin)